MDNICSFIDYTLLKQEASAREIKKLCDEAVRYRFKTVFVNQCRAAQACEELKNTGIVVGTVVGFPLGASLTKVKCFEAESAINAGAGEIDMVINIGAIKDNNYEYVKNDIHKVVQTISGRAVLKVILETCLLTEEEKIKACIACKDAGADFVKTSTGLSSGGATVEDIILMRKTVGDQMGVKAAGGIRDYKKAIAMIKAGASRIGTSSGVAIAEEALLHG
jgi:deoxyribose-phosphate aldolase